jgi:hypothetical protein
VNVNSDSKCATRSLATASSSMLRHPYALPFTVIGELYSTSDLSLTINISNCSSLPLIAIVGKASVTV